MNDAPNPSDAAAPADDMMPWQTVTRGSDLLLHASIGAVAPPPALLAEFTALDAAIAPAGRTFLCPDGSWSAIPLIERATHGSDRAAWAGLPTPALPCMPGVPHLLDRLGWRPLAVYVLRQPPRGQLPWHFDNQALHLPECRVLLPIIAPPGAVTLIGHEAAAYPAGTLWTGDFAFPHQVENRTDQQRVVLAFDLRSDESVRALFPAALAARAAERQALAQCARNRLLQHRAVRSAPPPSSQETAP